MSAFVLSALFATLLTVPQGGLRDTTRLRWVPNPRTTYGGWVSDPAHHLRRETVAAMDSTISSLEREKGVELALVVIDSLDGLDPADAALLLHRRWGVGKGARDNGIVLLWSPKLRKTFVSVGYGLEGVIPDAVAGRIQDQWVIPAFRSGDFDGGVLAGVGALAAAASKENYAGPPRARIGGGAATLRRRLPIRVNGDEVTPESAGPIIYYGILAVLAVMILLVLTPLAAIVLSPILFVAWVLRRYIPHRCPNGHGRMQRLSESEDDTFLSREEGLEEQLESVDYDVWVCSQCDYRLVIPHRRLFTKFTDCPHCGRRTLDTQRSTITAPTYTSEGRAVFTRKCRNCPFHDAQSETIPQLTMTSSSDSSSSSGSSSSGGGGSSGSSDFGGGSSGGGGAGRSY